MGRHEDRLIHRFQRNALLERQRLGTSQLGLGERLSRSRPEPVGQLPDGWAQLSGIDSRDRQPDLDCLRGFDDAPGQRQLSRSLEAHHPRQEPAASGRITQSPPNERGGKPSSGRRHDEIAAERQTHPFVERLPVHGGDRGFGHATEGNDGVGHHLHRSVSGSHSLAPGLLVVGADAERAIRSRDDRDARRGVVNFSERSCQSSPTLSTETASVWRGVELEPADVFFVDGSEHPDTISTVKSATGRTMH